MPLKNKSESSLHTTTNTGSKTTNARLPSNSRERVKHSNGPNPKIKNKPIEKVDKIKPNHPKHKSMPSPNVPANPSFTHKNRSYPNESRHRTRRNSIDVSFSSFNPSQKNHSYIPKVQVPDHKVNPQKDKSKLQRRKTSPQNKNNLVPGSIKIQQRPTSSKADAIVETIINTKDNPVDKKEQASKLLDILLQGKSTLKPPPILNVPPITDPPESLDYHSDSHAYRKYKKTPSSSPNVAFNNTFEQDLDMASHLLMNLLCPVPTTARSAKSINKNKAYAGPTFRKAPDANSLPPPTFTERVIS